MRATAILLVAAIASPALGQSVKQAGAPKPVAAHSAVSDVRALWKQMSGYVLQSAIDVPEDKYLFKATPAVRSFGELFAHVAGSQSMFCAIALGEKPPAEDAVKVQTKAGVIDALKKSNADCDRAYAQSDAAVGAQVDVFGQQQSRLYALMMNATHDGEHYGNLITYMRLNGMVPPSSK
ncbi:MAG: DinB family protein [Gemmatimonadaceae bacterium]